MLACDLRMPRKDAFFVMQEMRYAFLYDLGCIPGLLREVGFARAEGDALPRRLGSRG